MAEKHQTESSPHSSPSETGKSVIVESDGVWSLTHQVQVLACHDTLGKIALLFQALIPLVN